MTAFIRYIENYHLYSWEERVSLWLSKWMTLLQRRRKKKAKYFWWKSYEFLFIVIFLAQKKNDFYFAIDVVTADFSPFSQKSLILWMFDETFLSRDISTWWSSPRYCNKIIRFQVKFSMENLLHSYVMNLWIAVITIDQVRHTVQLVAVANAIAKRHKIIITVNSGLRQFDLYSLKMLLKTRSAL